MVSILVKIVVIVVSAIAGGFFGAWFSYRFQSRKIVKVRRIAIKALEIFLNYAKKRQTYDLAASEFNNKINIVEKRAILVALCKLGIPIVKPVDDVFCIEHVRFEHEEIDRDTINLMIEQINKGNCDELFFSDVEAYFSSNSRLLAVRAVAKKYVDIDFSKCDYDKTKNVINHPNFPIELFSPGECNVISVFRLRTNWDTYFDANGKAIPEKMTTLKKEIDLGIWDTYLFWDLESYQNMQNQSNMANVFAKVMLQNMGIQLNATASNEKFDEKK